MKVVSWNVRGLESPDRKTIVKNFMNSHAKFDIMMLQEVKMVGFNLDNALNFIYKDSFKIVTDHTKGKGGVALLINNKWNNSITNFGISPYNRAAWATFNINNYQFGICSLYASNDYNERIILWNWLTSLPGIPWFFGGDFNMVENSGDKLGGSPFEWKLAEKSHWDNFKQHFHLFDPLEGDIPGNRSLWFTWCNLQQGANRIYSRLDRFYVDNNFFSFSPNPCGSPITTLPATLSDHYPILAHINFRTLTLPHCCSPHKFILNVSLLENQDVNIAVKMIRLLNLQNKSLSHSNRWLLNISSWTKIFQNLCQKSAKDYRRIEKELSSRLLVVESNIQSQLDSIRLAEQVAMARNALRKHQHIKAKGASIRA